MPIPVLAFNFDEGTGTLVADRSGNSNHGLFAGGVSWTATAKTGKAVNLDGTTGRIDVPDSLSLRLSAAFTLMAWVRPGTISASWRDVFEKGSDDYYLMATSSHSGRPAAGAIVNGQYLEVIGPSTLKANTWSHLATTFDGQTLKLYVNGVMVASARRAGTVRQTSARLQVGGDTVWNDQYLKGQIDDARVYDVALTAGQVQADMATPVTDYGPPPSTTTTTTTLPPVTTTTTTTLPPGSTTTTTTTPAPGSTTTTTTTTLPPGDGSLVQASNLVYQGSFALPGGTWGPSSFDYGGLACTYNPANGSLFIVGHVYQQAIAEIQVPAILGQANSGYNSLPVAAVLQSFREVLPSLSLHLDDGEGFYIGGLMIVGSQLIGSGFVFYDSNANEMHSHFSLSSLNLGSASASGLFQLGTVGGGYVGGGMAPIPAAHQAALGGQYLTGQGALSIITRTNWGPGAYVFDPANMDSSHQPTTVLSYPTAHPLAGIDDQNNNFNGSTHIYGGMVCPSGWRSLLFFGDHGTGPVCYGTGSDCSDPERQSKGYHAYPYRIQVWAYDINDLAAVKAGSKQPWEVAPYSVWGLSLPFGGHDCGGTAYDPATGRLFIVEQYGGPFGLPAVHVYKIL